MPPGYEEPPNMDTKPDPYKETAFAPVCPNGHVVGFGKTQITESEYASMTICQQCMGVARYQVVMRIAEPQWTPTTWGQSWSTHYYAGRVEDGADYSGYRDIYEPRWTKAVLIQTLPR